MHAPIAALFAFMALATAGPLPAANGESTSNAEAIPMKLQLSESSTPAVSEAVNAEHSPLFKRAYCQYKVWSYGTAGCSGNDYNYEGVFSSTQCIALYNSGYRRSLYVEPQNESRCFSDNKIQMFKDSGPNYCAGGVKFTIDFGGTTCISPSGTHPFDSAILNL